MAASLAEALLADAAGARVEGGGERLTGDDLLRRAEAVALRLGRAGLRADEPLPVAIANRPGDLVDLAGVWLAGGVAVPVHRDTPPAAHLSLERRLGNRFRLDAGQLSGDGAAPPPRAVLTGAALVIFTSGSTGTPKGVVLGHGAFLGKLAALQRLLRPDAGDTTVLPLQLTFVFGLWVALQSLLAGGHLRLLQGYQPAVLAQALAEGATRLAAVPTLLRRLMGEGPPPAPRLACVLTGGEALSPALAQALATAWPRAGVYDLYGSTETGSCDFCLTPEEAAAGRGSLGRPTEGVAFRIDQIEDTAAPGELLIRTPFGMAGYLDQPDLTASAFTAGYFRTGDLVRRRADGRPELVGRAREIVARGGNKIAPLEVERLFALHPAVAEALACGLPDPEVGERLHLLLVPRPGASPDTATLRAWAAERIERWKLPDRIHLADSLPVGRTGKADRGALARMLLQSKGEDT